MSPGSLPIAAMRGDRFAVTKRVVLLGLLFATMVVTRSIDWFSVGEEDRRRNEAPASAGSP